MFYTSRLQLFREWNTELVLLLKKSSPKWCSISICRGAWQCVIQMALGLQRPGLGQHHQGLGRIFWSKHLDNVETCVQWLPRHVPTHNKITCGPAATHYTPENTPYMATNSSKYVNNKYDTIQQLNMHPHNF